MLIAEALRELYERQALDMRRRDGHQLRTITGTAEEFDALLRAAEALGPCGDKEGGHEGA